MYYYNSKATIFLNLLGFISAIVSIAGIVLFFFNPALTIICAIVSIINSLLQVFIGEQNNFSTEILTIVIAAIISFIAKISYINTICFALCISNALFYIVGLIFMAIQKHR